MLRLLYDIYKLVKMGQNSTFVFSLNVINFCKMFLVSENSVNCKLAKLGFL